MTRGNQREKAREKNQKKEAGKGKKSEMSGSERLREADKIKAIMIEKQKKAEEKKKTDATTGGGASSSGKK